MSTYENGTKTGKKESSNSDRQFRRKRKEYNSDEHYFTEEHDEAIVEYCRSDDEERRNELYKEKIDPVFDELIRKIMHTYRYHESLSNPEEMVEKCKSWIPTILDKFDPDAGSKAFTYFSVAVKNWFIQRIKKENKKKKREQEIDDIPRHIEKEDLIIHNNYIDDRKRSEFIETFKEDVQEWDKGRRGELLGENDKKVVKALQVFFDNPEDIEIINKRSLYLYMREITDLSTKQISRSLKKLRERYEKFKKRYEKGDYDEGEADLRRIYLENS